MAQRWANLWATPQAVAWEDQGYDHVVARYVLKAVASEADDATAALMAEVRQLEDRLGLAPMSLRRLAWEIAEPVETDEPDNLAWYADARRRFESRQTAPG